MNSSEFRVQSSEFRFSAFASGVLRTAALAVALPLATLNAAQVADLGRDGVGVTVESEPDAVDPARDFFRMRRPRENDNAVYAEDVRRDVGHGPARLLAKPF